MIIVDTNIIFSALVKDSICRKILLSPYFEFYIPEFAIEEIEKHTPLIQKKTGLQAKELRTLMSGILEGIKVVPKDDFEKFLEKSIKVMRNIDVNDAPFLALAAPFLALALSFDNNGIWSEDAHFQKQYSVKVWTTEEMVRIFREIQEQEE
jgi:predicted nucleic acid-binding protein